MFPFCPHNITKEEKRCEQLKKTNSKIIIKHTSLKLKFWSTINMKKVSTILSTILVCSSSGIFLDSLTKRSIFQQKQPICLWEEQIGKSEDEMHLFDANLATTEKWMQQNRGIL